MVYWWIKKEIAFLNFHSIPLKLIRTGSTLTFDQCLTDKFTFKFLILLSFLIKLLSHQQLKSDYYIKICNTKIITFNLKWSI